MRKACTYYAHNAHVYLRSDGVLQHALLGTTVTLGGKSESVPIRHNIYIIKSLIRLM